MHLYPTSPQGGLPAHTLVCLSFLTRLQDGILQLCHRKRCQASVYVVKFRSVLNLISFLNWNASMYLSTSSVDFLAICLSDRLSTIYSECRRGFPLILKTGWNHPLPSVYLPTFLATAGVCWHLRVLTQQICIRNFACIQDVKQTHLCRNARKCSSVLN